MALVDADYKFIWANLGSAGSASDALIYNNSVIKELAEDETITFPAPDPLPNDYQDVSYFFTGDDTFALRETMMKPYSRRGLDNEEGIFNYRPAPGGWLKMLSESWRTLPGSADYHAASPLHCQSHCESLHCLVQSDEDRMGIRIKFLKDL